MTFDEMQSAILVAIDRYTFGTSRSAVMIMHPGGFTLKIDRPAPDLADDQTEMVEFLLNVPAAGRG